ncbi:MAG: DEAD/DEAH box helicase [Prolixibacteraceae bacterium]|nr:DEAD/DEAH box helicase [Prolixibacteraceae bacterium]
MVKKNTNPVEFVMTLTEHRVFGHVLAPYLVQKNIKGTFYTALGVANSNEKGFEGYTYSDAENRLIELHENYSDEKLARKFSRNKGSKDFLNSLETAFFQKYIEPYIDKQIDKAIGLIAENGIKLFYKPLNYSNIYEEDEVEIMPGFALPVFHFGLTGEGLNYFLKMVYSGERVDILHKKPVVLTDTPASIIVQNVLYRFEQMTAKKLTPFFEKENIKVPASLTEKYLKKFVFNVVKDFEVEAEGFDVQKIDNEKKALISVEKGLDTLPMLVLYFQYGKKQFFAGDKNGVAVDLTHSTGTYTFLKYMRDIEWEEHVKAALNKAGLRLVNNQLRFTAHQQTENDSSGYGLIGWLNAHSHHLSELGIEVIQPDEGARFFTGPQSIDLKLKMEDDWFDLYAIVTFGEFQIPFIQLRKNILKGQREFILPNGEVAILPEEWFARYREIARLGEKNNDSLKFKKHHFKLLQENLEGIDRKIEKRLSELDPSEFEKVEIPAGLKAGLRKYQLQGFSWLYSMYVKKFGACLADDMGLGKTLQTLALLLKIKEESEKTAITHSEFEGQQLLFPVETESMPASLIVVPTSLIHNWQNEIRKFAPGLRVYQHVGSQRKKGQSFRKVIYFYDVILTTYGIARNDITMLEILPINYLILDESQYIKNPGSKVYQSVCKLNPKHKLVLTGTPIENSLSDLWAQMNFLNSGLLGNFSFFQNEFIYPVEKMNDEEKQKQLKYLISPFILRRKKEEVEPDLPPLTLQEYYCEMTEDQQKIYEEQKSEIRNSLLETIEKKGFKKSSFHVLQGLTRLRQLANHPALVKGQNSDSGKFNEVIASLEELLAENHKVLVFSSFVTHLQLFETEFNERGWEYCLLTGQTKNREKIIDDFQDNPSKRIFLISLKAGGVGLNLTSADYIFMLDPWWNPAAENQAISRAHRIGQEKKVIVYRFISEDTIEEKIQSLKERKSALAERFITSTSPFDATSADEIMGLFS